MTVAVFGSTGKTGQILVKKALDAGHVVKAFARNPDKISFRDGNLFIIQGDALDYQSVHTAVKGCDGVISLLGVNPKSGEYSFFNSMKHVFAAMKEENISRIVLSAGAGVGDPADKPDFMGRMMGGIIRLIARNAYEDGIKTAQFIRNSQDIQWSMIRIPMLSDKPPKQKGIREGYLGVGTGHSLYRGDLAAIMLDELENPKRVHSAPVFSN